MSPLGRWTWGHAWPHLHPLAAAAGRPARPGTGHSGRAGVRAGRRGRAFGPASRPRRASSVCRALRGPLRRLADPARLVQAERARARRHQLGNLREQGFRAAGNLAVRVVGVIPQSPRSQRYLPPERGRSTRKAGRVGVPPQTPSLLRGGTPTRRRSLSSGRPRPDPLGATLPLSGGGIGASYSCGSSLISAAPWLLPIQNVGVGVLLSTKTRRTLV